MINYSKENYVQQLSYKIKTKQAKYKINKVKKTNIYHKLISMMEKIVLIKYINKNCLIIK